MPVAIVTQDNTGAVAGANAYDSIANFKAYHALRGNDVSALSDDQIAVGLIRATDYIDNRWRFRGTLLLLTQTTQWPRADVADRAGNPIVGIVPALTKATHEYALRAAVAPLLQDTLAPAGGHLLKQTTDKVDVIETTVIYDNIPGYQVITAYPAADNYLIAGGLIYRESGIPLVR